MNKLISILFFIILINSVVFSNEITDVVEKHYDAFAKEDIDEYINTFIELDSKVETQKRNNVLEIWKNIDTVSYTLSKFYVDYKKDFGIVSYDVESELYFNNENKIVKDSYRLSTVLINENGWKIVFSGDEAGVNNAIQNVLMQQEIPTEFEEETITSSCGDGVCELEEVCETDCRYIEYKCDDCQLVGEEIDLAQESTAKEVICTYNDNFVKEGTIPKEIPSNLVGDMRIKGVVDEKEYFVEIKNGNFKFYDELDGLNYIISTDSCTVASIMNGDIDPMVAYNTGLIKVESQDFFSGVKTFIGGIILGIVNFFNPTPFSLTIQAETGIENNFGKYSFIGATSRGPGELYLGEAGANATYEFDSSYAGAVNLYVYVSDDSKHSSGSRNATFNVNGEEIKYIHKSATYSPWGKELIGKVNLVNGKNKIIVTKDASTSAAFVMDKMVLVQE